MTYIAISKNNELLKFNKLDEIQLLPFIQYIFKMELHEIIPNTDFYGKPVTHYNYRYTQINFDGTKRTIKKGKFELIDIGPDTRYFKTFKGRDINVYDHAKSSIRKFVSMTENENFIITDLLPTLNTLKITNSWDIYLELVEAKVMKENIVKLKMEIDKQKEIIKKLEEKIK